MPDQLPQNTSDSAPAKKPAIRTYKSDVEELFKSTKPSLIQIVGKEAAARPPSSITLPREESSFSLGRIFLVLFILFLLVAGGGGAYYFLIASRTAPATPLVKLVPPAALFATETSRTLAANTNDRGAFLRLMQDSSKELERESTIKRIIIKVTDGATERSATLGDIFDFYSITPPSDLVSEAVAPPMPFFYYTQGDSRFGIALKVRDTDRALRDMLDWESSLLVDLSPFLFSKKVNALLTPFEDRTYRNVDWRFVKLSQDEDLGIGYTVFPVGNVLVITFGKAEMETVINRLFDAR